MTPTPGTPTVSPSPTATPPVCVGAFTWSAWIKMPAPQPNAAIYSRRDGVNELVIGVNILLGLQPIENCPAFDPNHSGTVTVEELVQAVNNSLNGCPGE